jgi:hypothetical protein
VLASLQIPASIVKAPLLCGSDAFHHFHSYPAASAVTTKTNKKEMKELSLHNQGTT